eukprot:TRINITY_DN49087_c0_g1_i1.p1 TRINITY_DN49087_c0_g1~~TRINITY_DN49087_c0_g1_i1.p1  ORF type:complete len:361 (+),score=53.33 TRINITY_DN49087_c0_g1_i1:154-1236(+)
MDSFHPPCRVAADTKRIDEVDELGRCNAIVARLIADEHRLGRESQQLQAELRKVRQTADTIRESPGEDAQVGAATKFVHSIVEESADHAEVATVGIVGRSFHGASQEVGCSRSAAYDQIPHDVSCLRDIGLLLARLREQEQLEAEAAVLIEELTGRPHTSSSSIRSQHGGSCYVVPEDGSANDSKSVQLPAPPTVREARLACEVAALRSWIVHLEDRVRESRGLPKTIDGDAGVCVTGKSGIGTDKVRSWGKSVGGNTRSEMRRLQQLDMFARHLHDNIHRNRRRSGQADLFGVCTMVSPGVREEQLVGEGPRSSEDVSRGTLRSEVSLATSVTSAQTTTLDRHIDAFRARFALRQQMLG